MTMRSDVLPMLAALASYYRRNSAAAALAASGARVRYWNRTERLAEWAIRAAGAVAGDAYPAAVGEAVAGGALGAGAGHLAQPAFGGSSLTITALSPDTTTPYSNTQDFIYIQLSGNAPSGGTVISLSSSNQSAMPIPAPATVAAGSSQGQVEFTAGNVTTATQAKFTATLGSSSMSVTATVRASLARRGPGRSRQHQRIPLRSRATIS
jgi:hypothetical protein